MQISHAKVPVYGGSAQANGKHLFDVIAISHQIHRGIAKIPGTLELWCSRVPALSAYAYKKAVSLVLAEWAMICTVHNLLKLHKAAA